MNRISNMQAVSVCVLFLIGSSLFMQNPGNQGADDWLSVLVAWIAYLPLLLLCGRLMKLCPAQDLIGILLKVMGPWLGRFVGMLYVFYAFLIGSMVLRNFGDFCQAVSYTDTPLLVPILMLGVLAIWAAYAGVEVLARTSAVLFVGVMLMFVVVSLLGLSAVKPHNLLPILEHGMLPVLKGGFTSFSLPFGETILLITVFSCISNIQRGSRPLLLGVGIAGFLSVYTSLRNTSILGSDIASSLYFPSYVAISRIHVGEFIQRIEGSSATVFLCALFIKVAVCLLLVSKGTAQIFNLKSYRSLVLQLGLLMIYLSTFVFSSLMQMIEAAGKYYPYFAFPFVAILPLVTWIVAEFRFGRGKRKKA
ncbi:endospore germination permease [Gorillibacterium sp. CAU 1737]|uniref:GerAB/ArcD/ProY family transporter n=1 Tax=Gorillibacterium sp. CAU 1737 TaxID=3140362 RepID=UPI003261099D